MAIQTAKHPGMPDIRYAVRNVTAFIGHSFAEEDATLVNRIIEFLAKLGFECVTGRKPSPQSISTKVMSRLHEAEVFVGILTMRTAEDGSSPSYVPAWLIEEKAAALSAGKQVLLFVEEGVTEFGGLQGDLEYIPFKRDDLAPALIQAMDYVLEVSSVQMSIQQNGPNSININIASEFTKPENQIERLRQEKAKNPSNLQSRMWLSQVLNQHGDHVAAISELEEIVADNPNFDQARGVLAEFLVKAKRFEEAITHFDEILSRHPQACRSYCSFGQCLLQEAKVQSDVGLKLKKLERARRLLERSLDLAKDSNCKGLQRAKGNLFLVTEAIAELMPQNLSQSMAPADEKVSKSI